MGIIVKVNHVFSSFHNPFDQFGGLQRPGKTTPTQHPSRSPVQVVRIEADRNGSIGIVFHPHPVAGAFVHLLRHFGGHPDNDLELVAELHGRLEVGFGVEIFRAGKSLI